MVDVLPNTLELDNILVLLKVTEANTTLFLFIIVSQEIAIRDLVQCVDKVLIMLFLFYPL